MSNGPEYIQGKRKEERKKKTIRTQNIPMKNAE